VEANAYRFRALVSHGTDIYVLLETALGDHVNCYLAKLVNSIGQLNLEYPAAVQQSLIVLLKTKQIKLLVVRVPVATDSLKDSRTVVNAMSHNTKLGFR
jgi:hypothetical protein